MAQLGCAVDMHVRVQAQGGKGFKATLERPETVQFSRAIDETSTAQVVVPIRDVSCCQFLSGVRPWAHELAIVRDGVTVWEGPILTVVDSKNAGTITISARDLTAWFAKRRIPTSYSFVGNPQDLATIAETAIRDGMVVDDPNMLKHLQVFPTGVFAERAVAANTALIDDEIRSMVGNGLNFTTVGRRVILFGDNNPLATIAPLKSGDFLGDVPLQWDGLTSANDAVVLGEGVAGRYLAPGGTYGLLQSVTKVDGLLNTSGAVGAARAIVAATFPPPLFLTPGSVGQLRSQAPVTLADLVPGVNSLLTVDGNCSRFSQLMRLEKVEVAWSMSTERVTPTFAPFSKDV